MLVYQDIYYLNISFSSFYKNVANGYYGGISITGGTAISISYCNFTENSAFWLGGAINVKDSVSLIINHCNIRDNTAFMGGGISITGGTSTVIQNNNIYNNQVTDVGGGIYLGNDVSESIIDKNIINENKANSGGGIYMYHTANHITISNNILIGNIASASGGGVFANYASFVLIIGCTVTGNEAETGGGIHVQNNLDQFYIEASIMTSNKATNGAGCYLKSATDIQITRSTISDNQGTNNGGGCMILQHSGNIKFDSCDITGNSVSLSGGGLYIVDRCYNISIIRSLLTSNSALHGSGGGIYVSENVAHISTIKSSFVTNSADKYGGAIYISENVNHFSISSNELTKNSAGQDGGAIHAQNNSSNLSISTSLLNGNTALHGSGGAFSIQDHVFKIYLKDNVIVENSASTNGGGLLLQRSVAVVVVFNCSFTNNTGLHGNGGAIYMSVDVKSVSLILSQFLSNAANMNGGGIFASNRVHNLIIKNCMIRYNTALLGSGGGVFLSLQIASILIEGSTLLENSGQNHGGGIFISDDVVGVNLLSSSITSNSALHGSGGGIFLQSNISNLMIHQSSIIANSANDHGGGISVGVDVYDVIITTTTISDNSALYGGALFVTDQSHDLKILQCIFDGNIADVDGGGVVLSKNVKRINFISTMFTSNSAKGNGGGLSWYNNISYVSMSNCTMSANSASLSGGAMYIDDASHIDLRHMSCNINSAFQYGGGIAIQKSSNISIFHTIFGQNSAAIGAAFASMYDCSSIELVNVIYVLNYARVNAGAMFLGSNNQHLSLQNCEFTANSAASGSGGAIYFQEQNNYVLIRQCEFKFNIAADDGGGIVFLERSEGIFIINSSFISNVADYGGAVSLMTLISDVTVLSSYFEFNSGINGGCLHVGTLCNTIAITHSIFLKNMVSGLGGAVYANYDNSNLSILYSKLTSNTASFGGAVYLFQNNGILSLQWSDFSYNSADNGSAVFINDSNNISVYYSTFILNDGGAIHSVTNNQLILHNDTFSGNTGQTGAGIHSSSRNILNIINCMFDSNVASGMGGGGAISLGNNHPQIRVLFSNFHRNSASSSYGGALAVSGSNTNITLNDLSFTSNTALSTGGALYLSQATHVNIQRCIFDGGKAGVLSTFALVHNLATIPSDSYGGGVHLSGCHDVLLQSVDFFTNSAHSGGALAINSSSSITINTCVFSKNYADTFGSAVFLDNSYAITLTNARFSGNGNSSIGTLCWNSSTMSEPAGLANNIWDGPLKQMVGTTIFKISSPIILQPYRVSSDSKLAPVVVQALDYYGNILPSYSGTVSVTTDFTGCGDYSGFVSTTAPMVDGSANFTDLLLKCKPQGSYVLYFNLLLTSYESNTTVILSTFSPTSSPTSSPTNTNAPTRSTITLLSNDNSVNLNTDGEVGVSIAGSLAFLFLVVGCLYFFKFSKSAKQRAARKDRLQQLPLHEGLYGKGLLSGFSDEDLETWIASDPHHVRELDYDGRTPLGIVFGGVCKRTVTEDLVFSLLLHSLPEAQHQEPDSIDDQQQRRDCDWFVAITREDDLTVSAVKRVLKLHRDRVQFLADAKDLNGRTSRNLASPRCKEAILTSLYLNGKYEIRSGDPEHVSATSLVVIATEHTFNSDGESFSSSVALKFMLHRDQFAREIKSRDLGQFNPLYVIPILCFYDDDSIDEGDLSFREDAVVKGYESYPYCIVMEAANQSLKRLIDHGRIAGSEWDTIRSVIKQLATCLDHMHGKGYIHGDLKPLNVLQIDRHLKLTDLDAVVNYPSRGFVGVKYSSGYVPPEMLWMNDAGDICVREYDSHLFNVESQPYSFLIADPSYDLWGLGCILYLLCTGSALFRLNVDDNISNQDDLYTLFRWTDQIKEERLHHISDKYARNLVSLLLNSDPTKRITAARTLEHPFITNRVATRMIGDIALWDVFLSYRVDSDSAHAETLYDRLIALGLKVWWDKKCLLPGQPWEQGFCSGLVCSSNFVCLLSRGAISNDSKDLQNFSKFDKKSRCDNVLLEWRLALELRERGMIEGIFPVFIGDVDKVTGLYSNYFGSGCHPSSPDVVVDAVEVKVREHLNREGLGVPYKETETIKSIVDQVISSQGGFLVGRPKEAVKELSGSICAMAAKPVSSLPSATRISATNIRTSTTNTRMSMTNNRTSVTSNSLVDSQKLLEELDNLRRQNNDYKDQIQNLEKENQDLTIQKEDLLELSLRLGKGDESEMEIANESKR